MYIASMAQRFRTSPGDLVFFTSAPTPVLPDQNNTEHCPNNGDNANQSNPANRIEQSESRDQLNQSVIDASGVSGTVPEGVRIAQHVSIVTGVDENDCLLTHAVPKLGVIRESLWTYCLRDYQKHQTPVHFSFAKVLCSDKAKESLSEKINKIASAKVGCGYNDLFSADCVNSDGQESYYCCQFVRKVFEIAESGVNFPLRAMKFGSSSDPQGISNYWTEYFQKRGHPVPIGLEGSHPNDLLNSAEFVQIEQSMEFDGKAFSEVVA